MITAEITEKTKELQFPCLRKWAGTYVNSSKPLVVLFTSKREGIALAGVENSRVGVPEPWAEYDSELWESIESITLINQE